MHRLFYALTVALAGTGAVAQAAAALPASGDPLRSAPCREALDALQVQEAAATAGLQASRPSGIHRERAPDALLQAARRRAAQACLASRADPPAQPQRLAQPPVVVSPIAMPRPATVRPPVPIEPAGPPPKPADRPRFILSCDPGGCWANDGSRLNRVGPNLSGSRGGLCTVQGTLLQCP